MIVKNLKILLQNARKNFLIINTLLETQNQFDIIFIQEPPWSVIRKIPSSSSRDRKPLMETNHHPNWILFARFPLERSDSPRVIVYINICLSSLHFLLCKDIINHRDIILISFFNNNICYYIMNVYSDSSHSALKYLKDTEVNINNVLIMIGDFNIRDSLWNSFFPFHSSISDNLIIIADSFNLALSTPTNPCSTRYSNTAGEANSVINLMFLYYGSSELNHHSILSESCLLSDHAPLSIDIPIYKEVIYTSKLLISPKSNQKTAFIQEIISNFKNLDTSDIGDIEKLECIVNQFRAIIDQVWTKNAKKSKISKHSKQWQIEECSCSLNNYRTTRSLDNQKNFKKVVKNVKRSFFDMKIQEVVNKSHSPWKLINWISRCKLSAIEAIKHNDRLCLSPESLWDALYSIFNTALNRQVNLNILSKIECKATLRWHPFSKKEFNQAISNCNDSSVPGPNKLTWRHLKSIIKQDKCLVNIINIADLCINLGHWPNYFKYLSTVIIPKPNKMLYDQPKFFHPIVLLNTLGKLIEKVIAERIQFTVTSNDFIYPSQLGGLKFKSTTDASVALTHIVCSGQVKGKMTSTLAFDISQFFPLLNYRLLTLILEKTGFEPKVSSFFVNYLVKRKTSYLWNDLPSPNFEVNMGVG